MGVSYDGPRRANPTVVIANPGPCVRQVIRPRQIASQVSVNPPGLSGTQFRAVLPGPSGVRFRAILPGPSVNRFRAILPGPSVTRFRAIPPGPSVRSLAPRPGGSQAALFLPGSSGTQMVATIPAPARFLPPAAAAGMSLSSDDLWSQVPEDDDNLVDQLYDEMEEEEDYGELAADAMELQETETIVTVYTEDVSYIS